MSFAPLSASVAASVAYARPEIILTAFTREELLGFLGAEERVRHARFRFESDRDIYLVAHALTRRMLSRVIGVPSEALEFAAGEHGRPELVAPESARGFRFNLSHTHGLVACSVAHGADIGVDVEYAERRVDILGVARQVFSPLEVAGLAALSGAPQRERFFELWTLKEAYIKAIGKGLSAPLRSITFDPAQPDPVPVTFGPDVADDSNRWCLRRFRVGSEHRLALALAAARSAPVHCAEASPSDLR
ncbi:MAG TPA: 4'-phosphopantetheinyl transferase superfamily protein [Polyangiales bacterium]|nr:4'-phosphopantetheinyl transferase superfamily protein [Polyangiales bacterium]